MGSKARQQQKGQPEPNAIHRFRSLWVCLFLLLGTFLTFAPVLNHEFIPFDDREYVTENEYVQQGWTSAGLKWAFTSGHSANWHPLTWLSHMLDVELYGGGPRGHHLTSLLFHCLNTILLFLVLQKLTGAFWRSAIVAALFAIHPLRVESVAWVSERKDVLCTFFGLTAIWIYHGYVKRPSRWAYLGLIACFALGLMSKPMLVTLPCVLLLLDYWPLRRLDRDSFGRLMVEKLPLFALSAVSSVITYLVQKQEGAVVTALPLSERLGNALISYWSYIGKTLWPTDLSVIYLQPGRAISLAAALLAAALLAGVSVATLRAARRYPYLTVGWLWYLGTLVPVIGLVKVGAQSMADRYTYIPGIGLALMGVWGTAKLFEGRVTRTLAAIPVVLILVPMLLLTRVQLDYWQDGITLFQRAVEIEPENHRARQLLGIAFFQEEDYAEAARHQRETIRLAPQDADAYANLALALDRQGKRDEAMRYYREALVLEPDNAPAHQNYAIALEAEGRLTEAATHYQAALRIRPAFVQAHYNLALILARESRVDEAILHLEKAILIRPGFVEAHNNLGNSYVLAGQPQKARSHYQAALRIAPGHSGARANLRNLSAQ